MKTETKQNDSRKKLIVPVVALMLCAVAILGIGYGLTSSSTNENNQVSGTGLVVDLNNGTKSLGEGGFFTNSAQTAITYTSTQSNGNFTYTVSGGEIGKGILKITSTDTTKATAKVTATLSLQNCEKSSAFTFTMDGKTLTLDTATALNDVTLTSGEASQEYTLILGAGDTSAKPDVAFTYTIVFSVDVN
ncbi:hypothetical protein AUQ37_06215 [Candidatus Methanomethylophilus sp. 1R26]|uniref:hypothetical protein n=1 Tax=Candidatus Methanomethylophilus sp. 1R26 TaxID=1769296 RepID=UPI000735F0CA|nr:hypothetical protein [Candidatus Methanomethylophilus sp. 1R26]KUE74133.1 hypothetical protein AUQ37_06215 [Candidatus Methanomethylophilus sp. 1R26]